MKRRKILWRVLKRTGAVKLLCLYLILLAIATIVIMIVEPNINSFFDSLWYCFSVLSTVGFGDYVAITVIGRVMSIVLSIASILVIAVIPGIVTSFYLEWGKLKSNESIEKFFYDLERLTELSKEELAEFSEKVKKFHKNQ